jgi:SNF2 family DNA or RNA helicase
MLRLQQILGGAWLDNKDNNKLKELLDIVKNTDRQFIVWCRFVDSIDKIHEALDKVGISNVTYHGGTAIPEESKRKFISGEARGFIANLRMGAMGLNLQHSNLVLYYENGFSLSERWQSEDRNHRKGQVNKVTYIDLVYGGSIDMEIIRAIKAKEKIANYLIPSLGVEVEL